MYAVIYIINLSYYVVGVRYADWFRSKHDDNSSEYQKKKKKIITKIKFWWVDIVNAKKSVSWEIWWKENKYKRDWNSCNFPRLNFSSDWMWHTAGTYTRSQKSVIDKNLLRILIIFIAFFVSNWFFCLEKLRSFMKSLRNKLRRLFRDWLDWIYKILPLLTPVVC